MIFEFKGYRPYLASLFHQAGARSGIRTRFSEAVKIKTSFLSRVMAEQADLSLEQAERANAFLSHTENESHYFLLMVQKDRAGTAALRGYFDQQMKRALQTSEHLRQRIEVKGEISPQQRAQYYGSWLYPAVHLATTIPEFQTRQALYQHFKSVPNRRINDVVDFLLSAGLLKSKKNRLQAGDVDLHVGPQSSEIFPHYQSWRLKAIEATERGFVVENFHYSGVVTLSKEDVMKVRDFLMKTLSESIKVVKASKEEALYCLNMDFFEVEG